MQELEETCWQGRHLYWTVLGALPGLLCWALGIPGFGLLLLRRHRASLRALEVKERYGFLYKGYKLDTYYWESVTMYRKVAMIFIAVFLNGIGTMVQALVVILLLVFFVVLTQQMRPYSSRRLNQLELLSLVTSWVSFYCGLYFLSAKDPRDSSFHHFKDCKCESRSLAEWPDQVDLLLRDLQRQLSLPSDVELLLLRRSERPLPR